MEKAGVEIFETALSRPPSPPSGQNPTHTPINPFGELFSPENEQGLREYYKTCWLCEGTDIRSFSVLDFDDNSIEQMETLGFMEKFNLHSSYDNGMKLCTRCLAAIEDKTCPGFTFLPTHLKYFIEHERDDQVRRLHSGPNTPRIFPTAEDYRKALEPLTDQDSKQLLPGRVYTRYLLRDMGEDVRAALSAQPVKVWHGAPIVAIKRAWLANGTVMRAGLPPEVSEQLNELLDLYLERTGPLASDRATIEAEEEGSPSGIQEGGGGKDQQHSSNKETTSGKIVRSIKGTVSSSKLRRHSG